MPLRDLSNLHRSLRPAYHFPSLTTFSILRMTLMVNKLFLLHQLFLTFQLQKSQNFKWLRGTGKRYIWRSELDLEHSYSHARQKMPAVECEPPSPFRPHLDHVTGQYAYQRYTHDFMTTSIPTLPRTSSSYDNSFDDTVSDMPPVPALNLSTYSHGPAPSSLLCDNPYPSADYLALFSYTFSSRGLEDDSLLQQYTNELMRRSEIIAQSTEYSDMECQDQDASIYQFFDFSMGA